MAQCSTPMLGASGNQPIVKTFVGATVGTATTFGASAVVTMPFTSDALISDITITIATTSETATFTGKDWGGSTVTGIPLIKATDGSTILSSSALAAGTYYIHKDGGAGLFQSFTFTKSAGVLVGAAIVSAAYDFQANL